MNINPSYLAGAMTVAMKVQLFRVLALAVFISLIATSSVLRSSVSPTSPRGGGPQAATARTKYMDPHILWNKSSIAQRNISEVKCAQAPRRPPAPPTEDSWRAAVGNETFVYSAFVDPRFGQEHVILKVIALVDLPTSRDVRPHYCRLWLSGPQGYHSKVVRAASNVLVSKLGRKRYQVVRFVCLYKRYDPDLTIESVTLTLGPCDASDVAVRVRQIPSSLAPGSREFTVCLGGALRMGFTDIRLFVEWMELLQILGAEKILVYNHSGSADLAPAFSYYTANGVLEVIPWDLPEPFPQENYRKFKKFVNTVAQNGLLDDCLHRAMYRTRFLVVHDLDEMLVPRLPTTWSWRDMLAAADCSESPYVSARNVFFRLDWEDGGRGGGGDGNVSNTDPNALQFINVTHRESVFYPHKTRSKYIVRPEFVHNLKAHIVDVLPGATGNTCVLAPEVGALHHYRRAINAARDEVRVNDTVVQRYQLPLLERVTAVLNDLQIDA